MPNHYLNQCWHIVNWIVGNRFLSNLNQNEYIATEENAFQNVICKMAAILSQPQFVKSARNFSCLGSLSIQSFEIYWRDVVWSSLAGCIHIFSCAQATPWMVQSVHPTVRLSFTPFWQCSHHCFIMKFPGDITNARRGALFFSKVIHQISRSRRIKNCQFWSELSISGLWLQFEFTDGFESLI